MTGRPTERMAARVHVSRTLVVPDPLRVERCLRVPELGPRILFFSGGSALRQVSRVLKRYTHNSVHLITPFDSGGSSARLRDAFDMLSIGDLRSRLMALADETSSANPDIYALFSHRLPSDQPMVTLSAQLDRMVHGSDPMVRAIPEPLRRIVRTHLRDFVSRMPGTFDLRGASIGNLILAGGYLANERDVDSVVYLFSKLIQARGVVRPVVTDALHLCARYADGTTVTGQHRITGKETPAPEKAIEDMWLVRSSKGETPAATSLDPPVRELIASADVICYPVGSFYSSVAANLLPVGVGRAIVEADCPKVYVPSFGFDPEQRGQSVAASVEKLVHFARRDLGDQVQVRDVVQIVALDRNHANYPNGVDTERLRSLGVDLLELPLASADRPHEVDPLALTEVLLSLA
jgi:CofD-related protein of GAK system